MALKGNFKSYIYAFYEMEDSLYAILPLTQYVFLFELFCVCQLIIFQKSSWLCIAGLGTIPILRQ